MGGVAKFCSFVQGQGAWPYDAHVAHEDVEELGQLVDGCFADEGSKAEDSGVIGKFEDGAIHFITVFCFDFVQSLVGIAVHGAEFPHAKGFAKVPRAFLLVEDFASWVTDFDADGGNDPEGQGADEDDEGEYAVDATFDEIGPCVVGCGGEGEHLAIAGGFQSAAGVDAFSAV